MPVNVRNNKWLAPILILSLLTGWYSTCSADEDSATAADEGQPPADAKQDDPEQLGATVPDDPGEAYQLKQRKSVQALRRMDKSLLTAEVLAGFQKHYKAYRLILTQGVKPRSPDELEALKAVLAYRVYTLAERSIQEQPVDLENADKLGKALDLAGQTAKQHGAEVIYVDVVDAVPTASPLPESARVADALTAFVSEQARKHGIDAKAEVALRGDLRLNVGSDIIKTANEMGCDLILMASHVPGFKDHIFSSNAGYVASHAAMSVYVVR